MPTERDIEKAFAQDLPPRLEVRIVRALRRITREVDRHSHHLKQVFNITTPQLVCLNSVNLNGPMTLSSLATDVSLGMSTTAGIVDRLISRGLVKRQQCKSDRRKVDITITSSGNSLILAAPTLLHERFNDAFCKLSQSEQITLTQSLEKVVDLMNAATGESFVKDLHFQETSGVSAEPGQAKQLAASNMKKTIRGA